ncbi:hypothetical protein CLOACE_03590 [Clostridium acetireducens DSM 10703]|jgi:hypothetical protein|uniref:Bacterial Pleckstrin homology domain-containing protein n=1 Tax=Clostridium acetireducens DSM 10703 TaxID=1121290 RepID=A0A1E8F151_9CLOT|nr:PH domain-containing protein [Clostridium acetireducens]OFI07168.1 hypothetical protein CLOACE_03590 [Clostridium acetireducens DSM 10703]
METYKPIKCKGVINIILITVVLDIFLLALFYLVNSYELSKLINLTLIIFNIYQLYYILLAISLTYYLDEDNLYIKGIFGLRNIKIYFNNIEGYKKYSGKLKGIRISGYGRDNFALGKSLIKELGLINMFVTSSKNIIYIKAGDMSYGLSPQDFNKFENYLNKKGISTIDWEYKPTKNTNLNKDKRFIIPFFIITVIIAMQTLIPFFLYIFDKLPARMPLAFEHSFNPSKFGTGKQFAFKQFFYGVLNAAILFCMYYTSYFYSKYDRRSAYKYIYISLFIAVAFLIMQIRIISVFG